MSDAPITAVTKYFKGMRAWLSRHKERSSPEEDLVGQTSSQ
jgi:hypothetical protein